MADRKQNAPRNGTALQDVLRQAMPSSPAAGGEGPLPAAGEQPAARPRPEVVPGLGRLPGALPVGWDVIDSLRQAVSDDVVRAQRDQPLASEEDRYQRTAAFVTARVSRWATKHALSEAPLTEDQEEAVRQAVLDLLFKAGPLQRYLDDADVENIVVDGTRVEIDYYNRPTEQVEPVASSHEELVELVNALAARSGHGERRLTPATPMIHFRLPDRSRAAAVLLTSRPYLGIRRHRLISDTVEDLVRWGTLSPCLSAFLQALLLARKSVLVAGDVGVGKTTLLRALARKIPPEERVVTLESDRELYLDEDPPGGPHFLAMEARESNGERTADGKLMGEITVADMFPTTLRMLASRIIVGEVRGNEAVAMLRAMSAGGSGSMCTVHAASRELVIPRLAELCMEQLHADLAHQLIANSVNFVVYLKQINETRIGGVRHRFVTHVFEVSGGEGGRPAVHDVFAPRPGELRAMPHLPPACIEDLEDVGFDRRWLTVEEYGRWEKPLETVRVRSR